MLPKTILNWLVNSPRVKSFTLADGEYKEPGIEYDDLKVDWTIIEVTSRLDTKTVLNLYDVRRLEEGYHLFYSAFPGFHNDPNKSMDLQEIIKIYEACI